ncbi:uncharacterized protein LOC125427864 [Sphaerodactylus townsendi]|uniref:uncharacterized protein LOC125427864 n=1 Tax=Sphaerodactylus townsendi TaxID=933632 RepID=UPI002026DBA2|nr:uncharacterized protein LOC125427864 [Sphaerodactylus townsendi]
MPPPKRLWCEVMFRRTKVIVPRNGAGLGGAGAASDLRENETVHKARRVGGKVKVVGAGHGSGREAVLWWYLRIQQCIGSRKTVTLGRRKKKGIKCPKCSKSQNASHKFCFDCGERLAPSDNTQSAENKDARTVEEIETGRELKDESIRSCKPDGDEHPPTELMPNDLKDFLPESTGNEDWILPKKKRKKNTKASISELLGDLSSVPTTLDHSLNAETAAKNNQAGQNQAELAKSERGSTEDGGHQNKSYTFTRDLQTKQSCKTKTEKRIKQQEKDSGTKKIKQEEKATEKGNICEKAATPVKGTEEKREAGASNHKKQQKATEKGNTCEKAATPIKGTEEKGKLVQQTEEKKQQLDQNNKNLQKNRSQMNFGDSITVYFHAIIA